MSGGRCTGAADGESEAAMDVLPEPAVLAVERMGTVFGA